MTYYAYKLYISQDHKYFYIPCLSNSSFELTVLYEETDEPLSTKAKGTVTFSDDKLKMKVIFSQVPEEMDFVELNHEYELDYEDHPFEGTLVK